MGTPLPRLAHVGKFSTSGSVLSWGDAASLHVTRFLKCVPDFSGGLHGSQIAPNLFCTSLKEVRLTGFAAVVGCVLLAVTG